MIPSPFKMLKENFESNFGGVSERTRFPYTQIWRRAAPQKAWSEGNRA
jgi:hypothetical protein